MCVYLFVCFILPYTPTIVEKHKLKSGHHTGGKWFHPRPQTLEVELIAKPKTLLLVTLSIVKFVFQKESMWTELSEGSR